MLHATMQTPGGALTPADSTAVTVTTSAAKLAVTQQPPATATAGVPFSTPIQVTVEDATGKPVTTDNTTQVTLAKAVSSAGGGNLTCSGGLTQTAKAGIATFTGCVLDRFGVYTIHASAGSLIPTDSNQVTV
jgi:hypothetical protein